jgi:hypothetical protein
MIGVKKRRVGAERRLTQRTRRARKKGQFVNICWHVGFRAASGKRWKRLPDAGSFWGTGPGRPFLKTVPPRLLFSKLRAFAAGSTLL